MQFKETRERDSVEQFLDVDHIHVKPPPLTLECYPRAKRGVDRRPSRGRALAGKRDISSPNSRLIMREYTGWLTDPSQPLLQKCISDSGGLQSEPLSAEFPYMEKREYEMTQA